MGLLEVGQSALLEVVEEDMVGFREQEEQEHQQVVVRESREVGESQLRVGLMNREEQQHQEVGLREVVEEEEEYRSPGKGDAEAPRARAHPRHLYGVFGGITMLSRNLWRLGTKQRLVHWRKNSGIFIPREH